MSRGRKRKRRWGREERCWIGIEVKEKEEVEREERYWVGVKEEEEEVERKIRLLGRC